MGHAIPITFAGKTIEFTIGIVIDIRNHPQEGLATARAQFFVANQSVLAQTTVADSLSPGAFRWTEPQVVHTAVPRYSGRVAVLVDEATEGEG